MTSSFPNPVSTSQDLDILLADNMGDASDFSASASSIPYLRSCPSGHQLIVQGRPFLILGAELQNSSFSCPEYMQDVWPKLKDFKVNTVLANVSWETIEPREGVFEFAKLDQAITDARRHGLHLILLWFGAFKNAKSTYVPSWVKKNATRFPRAMIRKSRGQTQIADALSIFHPEVVRADAAAFGSFMRHIKEIDENHSTVLMVQVENEVGLLGDSRDSCSEANKIFHSPVPAELVQWLTDLWPSLHPSLQRNLHIFAQRNARTETLSWPEIFGDSLQTDELFMAYHFALYVEQVTRSGKAEYPLPMFTNVWQNYADEDTDKSQPTIVGGGGEPGDYPSGGGVINVLDIWQKFAPSLNFVAPDLYLNDYNAVCRKYRHGGQSVFIPEQRRDEYGARRIWAAYGTHHALCTSPFGIDTLDKTDRTWTKHFGLLAQISEYVLAVRERDGGSFGFFFDGVGVCGNALDTISTRMGDWKLCIERSFVFGQPGPGFGMIIQLSETRFLLVGEGFQVRFTSAEENALFTGILSFVEKVYEPRTKGLKDGRMLNGDETRSGEAAIMPAEHPDYGDFPISITIPARTSIAECEVYALF